MTVSILTMVLTTAALAQTNAGNAIDCTVPKVKGKGHTLIESGSSEELSRLRTAPHGAARTGKHQLQISWAAGKKTFADAAEAPSGDPPDVSWTYCGYQADLAMHLVLKDEASLVTGVLLDDKTGHILPGGEAVLFSPDGKYYIAYEQPDGQDGETIKLDERSGKKIWEGYNGVLHYNGKWMAVIGEFHNMRWDDHDRPQAEIHVLKTTLTMTLTEGENGSREWLPKVPDDLIQQIEHR